jgi:MFS transporter, DHA1 family, tetracycline resistance protein
MVELLLPKQVTRVRFPSPAPAFPLILAFMTDQRAPLPSAIRFVLATMLINSMGFGLFIPVFPSLVIELGHVSLSDAIAIGGLLSVTFAGFQFVFGPIMGNLSDRFGRRPILLGSLLGFAIDFLVLAFAQSLIWLFVARAFTGIFGATNAPAQSVIADVTAPEDRARWFGYISAAFGIGFVVGPALGGLLGYFDHRLPFYAASALAVANLIYGLIALPETLRPENRRAFDWKRANPIGALIQARKLTGIIPLASVYFLWNLASLIYPMTWSYFAIGRYGWSPFMVGISLAIMGVAMAVTQTLIAPRIVKRFGERRSAMIGLVGGATNMLALAVISNGWISLFLMPLIAVQSLVHPCLTAMLSRRADATTQGEVQGFASSVMAMGSVIAPLLFNPLLAWFTGPKAPFIFFGAAFVVAGAITLTALAVMFFVPPAARPDPNLAAKAGAEA